MGAASGTNGLSEQRLLPFSSKKERIKFTNQFRSSYWKWCHNLGGLLRMVFKRDVHWSIRKLIKSHNFLMSSLFVWSSSFVLWCGFVIMWWGAVIIWRDLMIMCFVSIMHDVLMASFDVLCISFMRWGSLIYDVEFFPLCDHIHSTWNWRRPQHIMMEIQHVTIKPRRIMTKPQHIITKPRRHMIMLPQYTSYDKTPEHQDKTSRPKELHKKVLAFHTNSVASWPLEPFFGPRNTT